MNKLIAKNYQGRATGKDLKRLQRKGKADYRGVTVATVEEIVKTIKLSAKDLFLIINALEIINPDDSKDEARARELVYQFYSLEANTEYALTVQCPNGYTTENCECGKDNQ